MEIVEQSLDKQAINDGLSVASGNFSDCIDTAVSLLTSLTETACEHEADLDLMRLINFMDLYRAYLAASKTGASDPELQGILSVPSPAVLDSHLAPTSLVSFEQFIGDSRLLSVAAALVTRESGESVSVPAPLQLSANV